MPRIVKHAGLFLVCLATVASARADNEPQTSILCWWEILISISAIGRACSYEQGTEMNRALEESIVQLDQFILAHSDLPNTHELLEKKKQELLAMRQDEVKIWPESCDPSFEDGENVIGLYQNFADHYSHSPTKLRAEIDEELAKPRKNPLAGICI